MIHFNLNINYIWQFRFENYADAVAAKEFYNPAVALQSPGGGFDSTEWLSKQKTMFELAVRGELPRHTSIVEFLDRDHIENIIDFGGGPGWIWAYLVHMNSHGNISYYNCELESSRQAFEFQNPKLPNMNFIEREDISDLIFDKNLLYCNSVLQYFEDNSVILELIQTSNPVSIILDDVAGGSEEFFSLQNYYGYLQINRFLNLERLINEVCSQGYKLLCRRHYQKEFSKRMVPKIWLGVENGVESGVPSSVTLVFDRI
jgi:putative methyltransferase (TIGR04325 family)